MFKLLFLVFFTSFVFAVDKVDFLNKEEQLYITKNKKISICTNPNWAPIEFSSLLEPEGISIDILNLLSEKLDLKLEYIKTSSWEESQKFLREKKCDILPSATPTNARKEYAIFTDIYLSYKLAIITQADKPFVENIEAILDKTMSRKKGSGLIDKLRKKYPTIKIVETSGYNESLQKVANSEVYYTVATLPVASYNISKFGFYNLHVAGYLDEKFDLAIAVRDDKKLLRDILNKTLNSIPKKQIGDIEARWSHVTIKDSSVDYMMVFEIVIVFLLVILFLVYRQNELKQHQKQLKDTNRKFEKIFANSIEGIVLTKDGKVIEINEAALKILELKNKNLIFNDEVINYVEKSSKELAYEKLASTSYEACEINLLKYDKTRTFPALIKGSEFLQNDEKLRVVSILDLTDIKHKEYLLSQSSKMAQMGEMIGNIAHQWRQPLSVVTTAATGIKIKKEFNKLSDEELFEFIDVIIKNAEHLSSTIDIFRNFIKEKVEFRKVVIQDRIDNALGIIKTRLSSKHIELINNIDYEKPLEVSLVQGELSQVIINILNNSVDVLGFKDIDDKWIKIDLISDEEFVTITIEDNGGGIDKSIKDKVFEPYFTTKHKSQGTGIGLYMSYDIVVNHLKGSLSFENTLDGVKFFIKIPV